MSNVWVVNASPIITLTKIGQLRLLDALGGTLLLPEAVVAEVLAGKDDDPAREVVARGWGKRCTPTSMPTSVLEWGLGSGESAVLATCLERRPATAVIDDRAARTAARALGVPVMGALGVVLRCKRRGVLSHAGPVIADLRKAGLHIDDAVIRDVLRRSGEDYA